MKYKENSPQKWRLFSLWCEEYRDEISLCLNIFKSLHHNMLLDINLCHITVFQYW